MGVNSLTRDTLTSTVKYTSALAGNDTADIALSSDFFIQEVILNGTSASVTLDVSGLAAQGYKHLQVRVVAINGATLTTQTGYHQINCNGLSTGIYAGHVMWGNGSSVGSNAGYGASATRMFAGTYGLRGSTPLNAGATIYDFLDFSSTVKFKTMRYLNGYHEPSQRSIELGSGVFQSTSPITSITFTPESPSLYGVGSRFSLYGSKG